MSARVNGDKDLRFREYYHMPGNLLKWFTLYGDDGIPDDDSWIWSWIPGGDDWKSAVKKYGTRAVEEATIERYWNAPRVPKPAFLQLDDAATSSRHLEEEALIPTSEGAVVFYRIAFPMGAGADSHEAVVAVRDQFDVLASSYAASRGPATLYYTLSGGGQGRATMVSRLCEKYSATIDCRLVGQFEEEDDGSGEALLHLHRHCHQNQKATKDSVAYLTNRLPRQTWRTKNKRFNARERIRSATMAVTSKPCLEHAFSNPTKLSCNACGSEFYALPHRHFTGNMFSVTCDYVSELLPPDVFEERMVDVSGDVALSALRRAFTMELHGGQEFMSAETLGLDQHSMEHWVGSHPDLRPCDVFPPLERNKRGWLPFAATDVSVNATSKSNSNWKADSDEDSGYLAGMWSRGMSLGTAPRRAGAPSGSFPPETLKSISKQPSVLRREYSYLAGNIYRWFVLYDRAPSPDSWVWSWYPEGAMWKEGVDKYGMRAVEELAGPYTDEGVYPTPSPVVKAPTGLA